MPVSTWLSDIEVHWGFSFKHWICSNALFLSFNSETNESLKDFAISPLSPQELQNTQMEFELFLVLLKMPNFAEET